MSAHAFATTLEVRVSNVGDAAGTVRVAVCAAEQWLKPSCPWGARKTAEPGVVILTIPDVPPGSYGILAHHDRNDDGEVNRDLFGRPIGGPERVNDFETPGLVI